MWHIEKITIVILYLWQKWNFWSAMMTHWPTQTQNQRISNMKCNSNVTKSYNIYRLETYVKTNLTICNIAIMTVFMYNGLYKYSLIWYYESTFKYLEIRQPFFILSLILSKHDECILQYHTNGWNILHSFDSFA